MKKINIKAGQPTTVDRSLNTRSILFIQFFLNKIKNRFARHSGWCLSVTLLKKVHTTLNCRPRRLV